jgi:ectoine hydroxylase-related dioxygenase (phytanoyl-CoA dioxygenase family)
MSLTAKQHAESMAAYLEEGRERALALGNRGPVRFLGDGSLHPEITDAFSRCGFYVFTGVIEQPELHDLKDEVKSALERAPVSNQSKVDQQGRPSLGSDLSIPPFYLVSPLGDSVGGTKRNAGRHPVKMMTPTPETDSPSQVVQVIFGTLHILDSCLRLYGHPQLLKVTEAMNGPDFTPFNEAVFVKQPGLGASVAWHQDATTHWDSLNLDEGTHGFNFMAQLYGCTAANAVWVVPGTHKQGKLDISSLTEPGSDRISGAVPMICDPGDVVMCNRQAVHGSFANTSEDWRVSVGFGFHRRDSVVGASAKLLNGQTVGYDEARVQERSRMIAIAIDARAQRYPDEERYEYLPLVSFEAENRFNEETRERVVKNYNLLDLHI